MQFCQCFKGFDCKYCSPHIPQYPPQYFTCLLLILIAQVTAGVLIYFQREPVNISVLYRYNLIHSPLSLIHFHILWLPVSTVCFLVLLLFLFILSPNMTFFSPTPPLPSTPTGTAGV